MNRLKTLVSGKRIRFTEEKLDLDLTFILERVIAMGYPASSFEALYRNSIHVVSDFFNTRFENRYFVVNLTEEPYDSSFFCDRVVQYGFPDHHSPPFDLVLSTVLMMDLWLTQNPENVVAVHCRAGKGRTGVIIICYLVFQWYKFGCELTPDVAASNATIFFLHRRGEGTDYHNQRRSIFYFASYCAHCFRQGPLQIYKFHQPSATVHMKELRVVSPPYGKRLYMVLVGHNGRNPRMVKRNTAWSHKLQTHFESETSETEPATITYELDDLIADDFSIEFYVKRRAESIPICWVMLNTRFLPFQDRQLSLCSDDFDYYDKGAEVKRVSGRFRAELQFVPTDELLPEVCRPSSFDVCTPPTSESEEDCSLFLSALPSIISASVQFPDTETPRTQRILNYPHILETFHIQSMRRSGDLHLLDTAPVSNPASGPDTEERSLKMLACQSQCCRPICGPLEIRQWRNLYRKMYVMLDAVGGGGGCRRGSGAVLRCFASETAFSEERAIDLSAFKPPYPIHSSGESLIRLTSEDGKEDLTLRVGKFSHMLSWLRALREAMETGTEHAQYGSSPLSTEDGLHDFVDLFQPHLLDPECPLSHETETERKDFSRRMRRLYSLTKRQIEMVRYHKIAPYLPDQPSVLSHPYSIPSASANPGVKKALKLMSFRVGEKICPLALICYLSPFSVIHPFIRLFLSVYSMEQLEKFEEDENNFVNSLVKYYFNR